MFWTLPAVSITLYLVSETGFVSVFSLDCTEVLRRMSSRHFTKSKTQIKLIAVYHHHHNSLRLSRFNPLQSSVETSLT